MSDYCRTPQAPGRAGKTAAPNHKQSKERTMNLTLDIDQYLSEDEKKEAAREAFKDALNPRFYHPEMNIDILLKNGAYAYVRERVAAEIEDNDEFQASLVENVKRICKQLSPFTVFSKGDRYTQGGPGYPLLEAEVMKRQERIGNRVQKIIDEMDEYRAKELLQAALIARLGGSE